MNEHHSKIRPALTKPALPYLSNVFAFDQS